MQDRTVLRTYRDRTYVSTAMVRHLGTTVAFAMDDKRRIYYSVLDLEQADAKKGDLDAAYWNAEPALLPFPAEFVDPYEDVPMAYPLPTVKAGGTAELRPQELIGGETDPFLSTTARLTAPVPIQAVSDGRYLLVFRQSVADGHADALYRTNGNTMSGDPKRTDYRKVGGAKVPAADASLLCDRYALVGSALKPVVEARYQRSRSKYTPAVGGTDTLGTRDMDGKQFYEPTTKLSFVPRLTDGGFAVMLLPTEVEGTSRWQLFVNNAAEKRIESYNCEQAADGMFDTAGTQLYTSPDPKFRKSVLEREPGTDPNTNRPLIPVPATTDRAGTALRFTAGTAADVRIGTDGLPAPTGGCTFEAWVKPTAPASTILASLDESVPTGFHLGLDGGYKLSAGCGPRGWALTGSQALTPGAYAHVAMVVKDSEVALFVDGTEVGRTTVPTAPVPASANVLGTTWFNSSQVNGFVGDIDEVRIWNHARTAADLADRGRRLIGTEPGLVGYLRMDEGAGAVVANLCDRRRDATVKGATWVGSDAPVGDGAGLARDMFTIKGREVVGGLTATLYFQQETQPSGYGTVASEKRQARVLLACATSGPPPQGGVAGRNYLCTLDLALDRGGRLAAVPRDLVLDPVGPPEPSTSYDRLAAAQTKLDTARARLGNDRRLVGELQPALNYIEHIKYMGFRQEERQRLINELPEKFAAQSRIGQDEAQVAVAEAELAAVTGGLKGATESVVPMPRVAVDRAGLSAYGALLTFAWSDRAPSLLESANGDVVLYYAGVDGQFFSVYYPTTVSRAARKLSAGTGAISMVSRDPAARLADFAVTVAAGGTADTCTVTVTAGTAVERFPDLPRAVGGFARVLNGSRIAGALLGRISAAQDAVLELAEPLVQGLAAGSVVAVGSRLRTVADTVATGSNKITLTVGGLAGTRGQDLYSALYDYAKATCTVPGVSLAAGSRIAGVTTVGVAADQQVADGTAADGAQPLLPRWRGDAPGRALTFGKTGQRLTLPESKWPQVSPEGDLTVEAWVNPNSIDDVRRIWHANTGGVPYSLALYEVGGRESAVYCTGGIYCGNGMTLGGGDFTLEFWARRDAGGSGSGFLFDGARTGLSFDLLTDGRVQFGWHGTPRLEGGRDDLGWHCWSVVYEDATRRRTIYCDGVQVAQDIAANAYPRTSADLTLALMAGWVDEFRIWGRARTATEVLTWAKRRLTGTERDLRGYWTFLDNVLKNRTGNGNDGDSAGSRYRTGPSAPYSFQLAAIVGSQVWASAASYPVGDWGHVAATFKQDWAVALDGSGHLDAGGPEGLDLTDELTIEAFVKLDTTAFAQGLVSKGVLETGVDDAVPYAFYVTADGQLAFTFESGDGRAGSSRTFLSGARVPAGKFVKVAVTRSAEGLLGIVKIKFYIDGVHVNGDLALFKGARSIGNDANCEIGRYRVGHSAFGLRGALSQVRIWNVVRNAEQIGGEIAPDAKGLVAWWRFPERTGAVTADACGTYPAQLRGATRVRTPDPDGNRIALYYNGVPSVGVPVVASRLRMSSAKQVTVGAMQREDGGWDDLLDAGLDELRVWRTCRTQEQILDNMFTRLRTVNEDLLAYYPIDLDSTTAEVKVLDAGPARCHLYPATAVPDVVISHAPISDDTAQVRSALTGTRTIFQRDITATPQAGEYADLQTDSAGMRHGVMKRAYSAIRNGAWNLTTGYKVGDLVTTWVGQAQFAPQLVGYLEGAPPVPSENLIKGTADDFKDASSVKFVQANTVTDTISGESKGSFDTSAKFYFKLTVEDDTYVVSAPLGAGTATPAGKKSHTGGASYEIKMGGAWSSETQVTQGTTVTRTSEVGLTGYWEPDDAKKQVNPTAGRRWVPANTGFAFVQSDTADQYALRLKHNGALVAYRMVPNPDIPTDWNVIPFPINPQYTKQGTLDGVVGFAADPATGALQPFPDPDFPKAGTGSGFSYHRPKEAYALKRRIQREERQLQGFYESVSADPASPDPVAKAADRVLKGMMGGTGSTGLTTPGAVDPAKTRAATKSAAKRNIVNTYVWTAAGGLFSEVTTTTDQVVQTTSGEFSMYHGTAGSYDFTVATSKVGVNLGFEATNGGGFTITRRKSKDASRTFGLEVAAKPSGGLQKQDAAGNPVFDAKNKPVLTPGRVDAYRFMTFYLDTSSDNFEDFYGKVVDPEWLETGTSPHARELVRARQADRKPPCWRVMHRVTYVSRVLDTSSPGAPSYAKALGALNLTSDHQLFQKLEPYLTGATSRLADLTAATASVLTANFPTLVPHTATVTERLAAYYQLSDSGGPLSLPGRIGTPTPTSNPSTPTPTPTKAALTVPATSPQGTDISVGYSIPVDQVMPNNWIGIYRPGAVLNAGSLHWQYASNANGTVSIPDSRGLVAGNYQLWLLANDGYLVLAGPYDLTVV
ncbi:LamG domain-containing protein [Kitasatospora griseola]|uniref:LamG domain-containing protein n=1 Tax=Kitasatospora griseola TaxID=2064 RepID=UPI0037F63ED1